MTLRLMCCSSYDKDFDGVLSFFETCTTTADFDVRALLPRPYLDPT